MIKKTILVPGDILFFKPKELTHISAWFISWAQHVIGKGPVKGKGYCHVAIVDRDTNYILEARWPKSHRVPIDWNKLDKAYEVELWRARDVEHENINGILEWCYANLGEWYDLGLFFWGMFDFKHMEVCSTYVAKAYANGGIVFKPTKIINNDPAFLTPDELAVQTNLIKRIV